ncbi:four helix bundle protein [bacterium]|nr:four helix bundle protein [Candidatus Celaenobacter polaris]TSA26832.1 MAG: four helix bundle protein [bacterium]
MSNKKRFDLEERTAKFGEDIIEFAKKIPQNPITLPLITQLVKAGTSVGANYCEADCAESKRDFEHKIGICKKESKESKHWLRMISKAVPRLKDEAKILWKEANELNLIFSSIVIKSRNKKLL